MSDAPDSIRIAVSDRIGAHDRPSAVATALEAVRTGAIPIPDLYDMLAVLLTDVGASWSTGELEVWQEHYATAIVRTIVEACYPLVVERAAAPIGRAVVLATPSDEYHDLGLRMLADRFMLAGWTVHLLGGNVPSAEVIAAVGQLGADTVVISVYTHYHRVSLKAYVDELRAAHPGLMVLVGGAAFAFEHEGWPEGTVLEPGMIPSLAGGVI